MRDKLLALAFLWLLLLISNPAHALTCTAPLVPGWKVNQILPSGQLWNRCVVGDEFVDPTDVGEECYNTTYFTAGPTYQHIMTAKTGSFQLLTPSANQRQGTMAYSVKRQYNDGRPGLDLADETKRVNMFEACVPPEPVEVDCAELEGRKKMLAAATVQTGAVCNPNNNCVLQFTAQDNRYKLNGSTPLQQGTYTGGQCNAEDDADAAPACAPGDFCPDDDTPCGTLNNDTVCADEGQPNCGTVNGEPFCAGPGLEDGSCTTTPGGQMVCIQPGRDENENVDTPPGPNNGTQGQPANSDGAVTKPSTGTTVHVYNSGTVNNSTHKQGDGTCDAGEEGTSDCPTHDGDGQCEAGEQGTPDCEDSGGDCDPEQETCGDGRVTGEGGTAKTFAASTGAFFQRVKGAPLIAGLGGLSGAVGAGECPELAFEAFGENISTEFHCELAETLSLLTYLLIALYCLGGIRIVMSA